MVCRRRTPPPPVVFVTPPPPTKNHRRAAAAGENWPKRRRRLHLRRRRGLVWLSLSWGIFGCIVYAALCIRRTLCRHVTIGTPMVIFAVWLFLTIGTMLVQSWSVTIGTPIVIDAVLLSFDCFWLFLTIGTLLVHVGSTVYQSSKKLKNSQKTVKTAKMTIGVPIVTCLHRVRRIHKVRVRRPRPHPRLRPPSSSASASAEYTKPFMQMMYCCCLTQWKPCATCWHCENFAVDFDVKFNSNKSVLWELENGTIVLCEFLRLFANVLHAAGIADEIPWCLLSVRQEAEVRR